MEKKQNQGNAFLLIWALRVWTVGDVEVHAAVVAAGRKAHEREEPVREAEACWRCTCMLSSHDNAHNIEDAQVQGKVQNRVAPAARSKRGERSNSCTQTFGTQHVDLCDRSAGSLELKGHPWLAIGILVLSRRFVALVFVTAQGNKELAIYLDNCYAIQQEQRQCSYWCGPSCA